MSLSKDPDRTSSRTENIIGGACAVAFALFLIVAFTAEFVL